MIPGRLEPTEFQIQTAFIEWVRLATGRYPELALGFHCPNGGARHHKTVTKGPHKGVTYSPLGRQLRALGVVPGVPDWLLPVRRGSWSGLALEFKSRKGGIRPSQIAYMAGLREQGWSCHVIRADWEEGKRLVEEYLRS